MKQFIKLIYIVTAILFLSCNSFGQQKDDYSTKIDSLIEAVNPRTFNGVVLISQNGKTKYSKAYGFANFDKKTPLKLDNEFEIMSNCSLTLFQTALI